MAASSAIEWTDSTFNPWIGCTKISPACDHCYAEAHMSTRLGRVKWGAGQQRQRTSAGNWRQPVRWNARSFWQCDTCGWRGENPHLDGLLDEGAQVRNMCPGCWPALVAIKPARRRVFCASLSDWLDNEVDVHWLADLLSLIHRTPDLDWLLLSKRIGNWRARISAVVDLFEHRMVVSGLGDNHGYAMTRNWLTGEAPANVWLGATICNQSEADRDVPKLLATPAAKRFLSIEPMLGPVDLMPMFEHRADVHNDTGVDWIICGGESGPHARPMDVAWAHSLRQQCTAADVPFFMKQMGGNRDKRGAIEDLPLDLRVREIPCAGRFLDGVEHNGFPVVTP